MALTVFLTRDAKDDLIDIYDYITQNDAKKKASDVLDQIENLIISLSELPERGRYPKELLALGIQEYREVSFKPYRIIYRIVEKKVFILLIVDGRRDMQSVLEKRLLKAPRE